MGVEDRHRPHGAGCAAAGDHACLVFSSDRERREQLAGFLRGGFDAGERVLYLADAEAIGTPVLERAAAGVDVRARLASGQLDVRTTGASYLRGGRFEPAAMTAALGDEVARARADGWRGLRITGEMTWALGGAPGCELLLEYERDVQSVLDETGAMAICQYDARRFASDTLRRTRALHPIVLGELPAGPSTPRLRVERLAPRMLAVAGEVDFANASRLRLALCDAVGRGGDVTLASRGLTFLDAAGVRTLCGAASALAERGHRLVVLDPPGVVARAIELVAATGLPGAEALLLRASAPPV